MDGRAECRWGQFHVVQPGDVHGEVELVSAGHMHVLVVLGCTSPSDDALASGAAEAGRYQQ
jgi:hypothetical protein